MNTMIEEIRKRIKAASDDTEAGPYDEYESGQGVGLATALQIIDEVVKEQSATTMNQDEIKSCQELYNDIDSCIEALIKARLEHNQEDEGKALFRMEGLMVAALQQLSYFIDKPIPADVEEAAEMAARRAYPYEGGTKGDICEASIPIFCKGFKAGIAYERERKTQRVGEEWGDKVAEKPEIIFSTDGELTVYSFVGAPHWWATIREAEEALSVFKAGAEWQRNKPVPEDVQEAARAYSARVSNGRHFRDLETGYAAGMLAERERLASCPTIKGWVARDTDNALLLFSSKPERFPIDDSWDLAEMTTLPGDLFPDLKREDEPREVEIIIKEAKK